MAFDLARIPEKLKHAYAAKRCSILVGAGASAGAGLPLWGSMPFRVERNDLISPWLARTDERADA